jgi:hypothetical protein
VGERLILGFDLEDVVEVSGSEFDVVYPNQTADAVTGSLARDNKGRILGIDFGYATSERHLKPI